MWTRFLVASHVDPVVLVSSVWIRAAPDASSQKEISRLDNLCAKSRENWRWPVVFWSRGSASFLGYSSLAGNGRTILLNILIDWSLPVNFRLVNIHATAKFSVDLFRCVSGPSPRGDGFLLLVLLLVLFVSAADWCGAELGVESDPPPWRQKPLH
jgi:hypothetical protein